MKNITDGDKILYKGMNVGLTRDPYKVTKINL